MKRKDCLPLPFMFRVDLAGTQCQMDTNIFDQDAILQAAADWTTDDLQDPTRRPYDYERLVVALELWLTSQTS